MPCAQVKNAPGLDIIFDEGTPQVLVPGQTLAGRAVLTSAEESVSIGSVTATLYGRSKVKIFQSYGQSSAVYKSRATFFNLRQQLFKSDYTYGVGTYSWPFSIQLPFVADEACLRGRDANRFKQNQYYLSNDTIDVVAHGMPPPVFHYHGMWGRAVWAFVEYVLEVTVTEASGTHRIRKPQSRTSVRPINFQPGQREDVLRDFAMQSMSKQLLIKSSRLVSDVALQQSIQNTGQDQSLAPIISSEPITKVESSGGSQLRAALSRISVSSSTPRLGLDCMVTYPTVVQVYHPESLPFKLTVSPNLDPQATNIDPLTLPQIRITSFDLQLVCMTRCRALTGLWQERDAKAIKIPLAKEAPLDHIIDLKAPTTLSEKPSKGSPPKFQNAVRNASTTVNLGNLLPLRITSAKIGRYYESILNPSFKTYNIMRVYGLEWEIELEIIGPRKIFKEKIKGKAEPGAVTVRGIPDSLRAEAMRTAGPPSNDMSSMAGLSGLPQELEDDGDDDGDEDVNDDDEGHSGQNSDTQEGGEKKSGIKGLFRRSHDGGRSGKKSKEEYAREDAQQKAKEEPPTEQLPKYEA